jgi:hypothetical protein
MSPVLSPPEIFADWSVNAALTGTVLLQFVATCALAGIAWNEAVMHIPLLVRVGRGRFRRYDSARRVLQPLLSMPLMAIESATALAGAWMAGTPLHLAGVLLLIAVPIAGRRVRCRASSCRRRCGRCCVCSGCVRCAGVCGWWCSFSCSSGGRKCKDVKG